MSLTTAQKATLKTYLTANPDSIPSLSSLLTAENFSAVADALNVATGGKSARKATVAGQSVRFAIAKLSGFSAHANKQDLLDFTLPDNLPVSDDMVTTFHNSIAVDDATQAMKAAFDASITLTPASLVQALLNDASYVTNDTDVAAAWRS